MYCLYSLKLISEDGEVTFDKFYEWLQSEGTCCPPGCVTLSDDTAVPLQTISSSFLPKSSRWLPLLSCALCTAALCDEVLLKGDDVGL